MKLAIYSYVVVLKEILAELEEGLHDVGFDMDVISDYPNVGLFRSFAPVTHKKKTAQNVQTYPKICDFRKASSN